VLGLSVALTFTMLVVLIPGSQRAEPRPPKVTWITSFEEGRSDAVIQASNRANQLRQEQLARERAEREEQAKAAARRLGRATGIDVDAMEADIKRREAAQKAAAARQASPGPGAAQAASER
jgi:hypothetical protein